MCRSCHGKIAFEFSELAVRSSVIISISCRRICMSLLVFSWMILQARMLCSFICGICAQATRQEWAPHLFRNTAILVKLAPHDCFTLHGPKSQQKKNLLKIQGKLPKSSWTLGYLVEFSNLLKSLIQNAQSIRILRTGLSTWELIFHLSFLWLYWKVIIPSVLSV